MYFIQDKKRMSGHCLCFSLRMVYQSEALKWSYFSNKTKPGFAFHYVDQLVWPLNGVSVSQDAADIIIMHSSCTTQISPL